MSPKIVDLRNTKNKIVVSLPEDEAIKLMTDLNIALDRIRCINSSNIIERKLTEKERELIQRAILLKNKGEFYKYI
jgi:uncharacterized protein YajQ (UPF0234 family)